jgi:hypothetical protein
MEIPWDPLRPADAVAALRSKLGRPTNVSLAIGLGFLQVMRVDLPPVAPRERAQMIELEPDRFFAAASREALVTTVAPEAPFAFGASSSMVAAWIAAFETWAPVVSIEPAPIAVGRALAGQQDGIWRIEAGDGETGMLQIDRGRIASSASRQGRRRRQQRAAAPHHRRHTRPVCRGARCGQVAAAARAGSPVVGARRMAASVVRETALDNRRRVDRCPGGDRIRRLGGGPVA